MKNQIFMLTLALFFALTSCSSPDDIVRSNIEDYLFERMDNPDSYEFVKLEVSDTIRHIDNIENRRKYIMENMEGVESTATLKERFPGAYMYMPGDIPKAQRRLRAFEINLERLDSLEKALGENVNDVAAYTYKYAMRGDNRKGAKVLKQYYVQVTPDYEVINLVSNHFNLNPTPNEPVAFENEER